MLKGTQRRKKKVVHKTATTDDKKLQGTLKKLSVNPIPGIEEVNMIREDGTVLHFTNPKGFYSIDFNLFKIVVAILSVLIFNQLKTISIINEKDSTKCFHGFQFYNVGLFNLFTCMILTFIPLFTSSTSILGSKHLCNYWTV